MKQKLLEFEEPNLFKLPKDSDWLRYYPILKGESLDNSLPSRKDHSQGIEPIREGLNYRRSKLHEHTTLRLEQHQREAIRIIRERKYEDVLSW